MDICNKLLALEDKSVLKNELNGKSEQEVFGLIQMEWILKSLLFELNPRDAQLLLDHLFTCKSYS